MNSAQAKLAKSAPGSKQRHTQQDLFTRLQADVQKMDEDIMVQEASFFDFTRQSTKTFMGLKFGGLQTLCNKGLVRRVLCGILKASQILVNRLWVTMESLWSPYVFALVSLGVRSSHLSSKHPLNPLLAPNIQATIVLNGT